MADLHGNPSRKGRGHVQTPKTLELSRDSQLLICNDLCKPVRACDFGEVLELLPELLERLKREQRGALWRAMANLQRRGAN